MHGDHEDAALKHAAGEYGIALGDPKAEQFLRSTSEYQLHLIGLHRRDLAEEIGGTILRTVERLQRVLDRLRRITRRRAQ